MVDLYNWEQTKKSVELSYPIDLLVNNAGIGNIIALTDVTEEDVDK